MRGVSIDKVTEIFTQIIKRKLKGRVKQVILFGSRARGTATKASDYDFLVVVDKRDKHIQKVVLDTEVKILNKYDAFVEGIVCDEPEWERTKRYPIGSNIIKDGIEVHVK